MNAEAKARLAQLQKDADAAQQALEDMTREHLYEGLPDLYRWTSIRSGVSARLDGQTAVRVTGEGVQTQGKPSTGAVSAAIKKYAEIYLLFDIS